MATTLESPPTATAERAAEPGTEPQGGRTNVSRPERLASVAGGGLLTAAGLKRGGLGGVLLGLAGAALVQRGVTGHCQVYGALGLSTAEDDTGRTLAGPRKVETFDTTVKVRSTATVNRPREELYRFWRDQANVPRFVSRIDSVRVDSPTRSHWVMSAPLGRTWEWDSEITEETEGERFAWRSLEGADLPNRGSVSFRPSTRGDETVVTYEVEFDPPGGAVGAAIANVFHEVPETMARQDLRRFKALMEAGEIATTTGQPSCRGRDD